MCEAGQVSVFRFKHERSAARSIFFTIPPRAPALPSCANVGALMAKKAKKRAGAMKRIFLENWVFKLSKFILPDHTQNFILTQEGLRKACAFNSKG